MSSTYQSDAPLVAALDPTDYKPNLDLSRAAPFRWQGDSGTACLLVHGFTGTPYEVRELGERLHAAGHTASGVLLPGHGSRIEELARCTWTDWTSAYEEEWERLRRTHDRVVAGGVSMGAALALWLAGTRPVDGVIGIGSPYRLQWGANAAYLLRYIIKVVPKPEGSSIADPDAKQLHPTYVGTPLHGAAELLTLLRDMRRRLEDVTAPLLLVHSWDDPVVPRKNPITIRDRVGSVDTSIVWVYNSAHVITEDYDKEEVFATCIDFVDGIEQTATT